MDEVRHGRYSSWVLERLSLGEVFRLRIGISSIGRHSSNLIRITDSDYVSRNHATIEVHEDDRTVEMADLQSVNGVSVNDNLYRTSGIALEAGDKIGIGVIVDEEINNENPTHPVFVLKNVPLPRLNEPTRTSRPCPLSFKNRYQNAPDRATDSSNPSPGPSRPAGSFQTNQESTNKPLSAAASSNDVCIIISDDEDYDYYEHKNEQQNTSYSRNEIVTSIGIITNLSPPIRSGNGEKEPEKKPIEGEKKLEMKISTNETATRSSVVENATCSNVVRDIKSNINEVMETNETNKHSFAISNASIQSISVQTNSLTITTNCDFKKKDELTFIGNMDIAKPEEQNNIKNNDKTDSDNIDKPIDQNISLSDLKASAVITANVKEPESIQSVASTTQALPTDEQPSSSNKDNNRNVQIPIISSLEKEQKERVKSISSEIQNIFGDADEVIMDKLININPQVYNDLNSVTAKESDNKNLKAGDFISLLSEDESDQDGQDFPTRPIQNKTENTVEVPTVKSKYTSDSKSPNIFESSLNDSNDVAEKVENTNDLKTNTNSLKPDIIGEIEKKRRNRISCSDEEMMFSQVVINDMKAELADENIDDLVDDLEKVVDEMDFSNEPRPENLVPMPIIIKTELDTSCWSINDHNDDEFDAELENKVSDWSAKLFSQNLSQANQSQIYENEYNEDEESYENSKDQQDENCDLEFWTRNDNDVDEFLDELYITLKEKCNSSDSEEVAGTEIETSKKEAETVAREIEPIETSEKEAEMVAREIEPIATEAKEGETVPIETGAKEVETAPIETKAKEAETLATKIETEAKEAETLATKIETEATEDELDLSAIKPSSKKGAKIITDSSDEDNEESEFKAIKKKESNNRSVKVCLNDCAPKRKFTKSDTTDNNVGIKIKERRKSMSVLENIKHNIHSRSSKSRRNSVNQKPSEVKCVDTEENINHEIVVKEKSKSLRGPPEIIEAPQLPACRGKLRGVSASRPSVKGKLSTIREKNSFENIHNNLKRNLKQIPSLFGNYDKEYVKLFKESRKERLKELANKNNEILEVSRKRKPSRDEDNNEITSTKKPKVKVTIHNRGAFLTENVENPVQAVKAYKIPKNPKTDNSHSKDPTTATRIVLPTSNDNDQSSSSKSTRTTERKVSFEEILSKCDLLPTKSKQHAPSNSNNESSSDFHHAAVTATVESKSKIASRAKRTTNKLTFASMQRNFVESDQNQKKLELVAQRNQNPNQNLERKKKVVRFNDTPIIHYIDRIYGAKKVDKKDVMPKSTINDRRQLVRSTYPILDCTSQIISMFLMWSNEWLEKRNSDAHAALEVVLPMPAHFTSFDNYKSVMFPLMKMEFFCVLEQGYKECTIKPFKVLLQYITDVDDRFMLFTKYHASNKCSDVPRYDLVILNFNDQHSEIFAYLSGVRKGTGTCITLVFEILSKNYTKAYLNCIKEIDVRPVIDNMRIEFGAFNAVFQLESTPLFKKILNPLELLKNKFVPKEKIRYKGFDRLNKRQEQVVINTYAKILDESTPNITLIKGPPGTGKSCVISNLALQSLYGDEVRCMDKKILICAQSNVAVDLIASKLYDVQHRMRQEIRFRVIRYGMPDKIHPEIAPITLRYLLNEDKMKKLSQHNRKLAENKENVNSEIQLLEMQISEMQMRNVHGTFEEDELIEKQKQLQILRSFVNQSIRPEDERSIYTWYLTNANIVCTTLSSCVKLSQYVNYFDICIIDEATQCVEPWTLLPLKFGISSLILVGDTQQLPATVLSKKAMALGFGNSMFTRMQRCLESVNCASGPSSFGIICSLTTQYRMHPEICKWPNSYFYKNELINADITQKFKTPIAPFSIINLEFLQNEYCSDGKISNNLEAEFVVKLLQVLDGYIPHTYNSYGIITPYAQHRTQLITSLAASGFSNTMVNTIDSYQGIEKDVIIISNARTNGIGFLSNYQRLNVALTRPRKCLILCGNFKHLETVPSWRSLLSNARERNLFHDISAENALDIHRNVIEKIKTKN